MLEIIRNISLAFVFNVAIIAITIHRILMIKRDATTAVAWTLAVLLLPLLGAVAFWTMGDPTVRRSLRHVVTGAPIYSVDHSRYGRRGHRRGKQRDQQYLQRLLGELSESPATEGNEVTFFTEGEKLFRELAARLEAAEHEICFQFYIYRNDDIGRKFASILKRKAKAGCRVYFLYDAIGSKGLGDRFLRDMRAAGVRCLPFLPFNPLRVRIQLNFRNHRKLVVIDRNVAYTGGMNVGEEYAGRSERYREWFDVHMRVEGPAVSQLFDEFAADWVFACRRKSDPFPADPSWFTKPVPESEGTGWVQTVSSGPDQTTNRMHSNVVFAMTRAEKRIWIATPYFVPDAATVAVLRTAALAGMDVRVFTQGDKPDKWLPYFGARYYWGPLLKENVRVYQMREGMMHAKMILVDDTFATVGSANLDIRSLALNFELNLNLYSPREIGKVEKLFYKLERKCFETTVEGFERRRHLGIKILENVCRLFAPNL